VSGGGPPPAEALSALAEQLRREDTVISAAVREPRADPVLGRLVAAGPLAASAPGEYALLVEAIREGYLLHYGTPRVVLGADRDLALLAGDYLYARGLQRLAGLGDLVAVRELSDLISLSAQIHAEGIAGAAPALWLGSIIAVAAGTSEVHERGKAALRAGASDAAATLRDGSHTRARDEGLSDLLAAAEDSINSAAERPPLG
jgi:hypothetical protein